MKISEHADRSEARVGIRGEDIHRWLDSLFDAEGFDQLLRSGRSVNFDPYDHRKFRHCREAIEDAVTEFKGKYTPEEIRAVCECHIMDDYDGYLPSRDDFTNGTFTEKYHESEDQASKDNIFSQNELEEYFKGKSYSSSYAKRFHQNQAFRIRIILPTIIAIVVFAISAFVFIVPAFKENMLEQKKQMIRELTSATVSMIKHHIHLANNGKISLSDAQKEAAEKVSAIRYGVENKDYFWITDMSPRMVMHPYRPDLVGKDLSHYSDTKGEEGQYIFVEFVDIVKKKKSGYLRYLWQWMDDSSRKLPKLSYVMGIEEWGWIVGTGIYIDDIEQESRKLTHNLIFFFIVIGVLLGAILLSIVFQSKKIEAERVRAESGLLEAKDRYRALVDASKEGYILLIDGECVYSNRMLQEMTGREAKEIVSMGISNLLMPQQNIEDRLNQFLDGSIRGGSFEAELKHKEGKTTDVIITTSKIFFSENQGHVVSFRPIKRIRTKSVLESLIHFTKQDDSEAIIKELKEAAKSSQVVMALNRLSLVIRGMAESGVRPGILRELIGECYDAALVSLMRIALKEMGEPPVEFAFLSLGSNARHEMTMFSDQDNALVFEDVDEDDFNRVSRYFLKLSDLICTKLDAAGYSFCPGGVMAMNPKWCLPKSQWKKLIKTWTTEASPQALLELNVIADMRAVFGKESLANELITYLYIQTKKNKSLYMQFGRNCLRYKPRADLVAKEKILDLKECLKPIEIFSRIHAIKYQIYTASTIERLNVLPAKGAFSEEIEQELIYIFDYLWRMRFYNQYFLHADLREINDQLETSKLSKIERQNLNNVLIRIRELQEKFCIEFLGMPLHMLPDE